MSHTTRTLITGASSGLGEGLAWEFAARGHQLALCARRLDRLEALRDALRARYPHCRVVIAELDVTDHGAVFDVFKQLSDALGGLDRVIVNAGIGKGAPIGSGGFSANLATVNTNFTAALAQCEAAVQQFRAQNQGHLVVISSVTAYRGMAGATTAYAASKAAVATLAEGIRSELWNTPIRVTTLFPGYIRTDINARLKHAPFIVDREQGCRALAAAIERGVAKASIPRWPWGVIGLALRLLPLGVVRRLT